MYVKKLKSFSAHQFILIVEIDEQAVSSFSLSSPTKKISCNPIVTPPSNPKKIKSRICDVSPDSSTIPPVSTLTLQKSNNEVINKHKCYAILLTRRKDAKKAIRTEIMRDILTTSSDSYLPNSMISDNEFYAGTVKPLLLKRHLEFGI